MDNNNHNNSPQFTPPPQPSGSNPYGETPPNNNAFVMGIVSLVASFFCAPFNIIFGFIAVAQANKAAKLGHETSSTKNGRIMGIIGIILGIAFTILSIILVAVYWSQIIDAFDVY